MHRTERCLNCGQPAPGEYCACCGQRNADLRVSFGEILWDALDGLFQLDSRIARTIFPFLFRPGTLIKEYNAGRRTRYSSPFRVYLLMSIAYFFTLSVLASHLRIDSLKLNLRGSGGDTLLINAEKDKKNQGKKAGARDGARDVDRDVDRDEARDEDRDADVGSEDLARARTELQDALRHGKAPDGSAAGQGTAHAFSTRIQTRILDLLRLPPQEAAQKFCEAFLNQAPKMMFLLLPVFALLLKLLFRRGGRYYIEHLVFALYVHAHLFFILLLHALLSYAALGAYRHSVLVLPPLALLSALRTFYGQTFGGTLWRFVVLCALYLGVLLLGAGLALVVTLYFL